jgi:hypothetical protein
MPIKILSRSETHLEDHPETNVKLSDFDVVPEEETACLLQCRRAGCELSFKPRGHSLKVMIIINVYT